ncbi:MAG TPA: Hsp20/alpha crystallin family protein [Candidatus Paceibacterota bacterium]
MKKRSFFERLAGNLRFNDNEEELDMNDVAPVRAHKPLPPSSHSHSSVTAHHEAPARRELPLNTPPKAAETKSEALHLPDEDEEVGELPVDVYETPNEIIIQTLIAGVLPEHLSIGITRDVVSISGKREANKSVPTDAYQIRELYWGSFERTVELPEEVEIDGAEAIERHGMLLIKLPKLDKKRKTVLKIKSI